MARAAPAAGPDATARPASPSSAAGPAGCCCASAGFAGSRGRLLGEQLLGPQAEGDAELVGVEVGERARLRQDEVGDVALAGHDLLDPLVDGAGAHEAVRHDGAGLADAPRAVAGLVLDRGVPPAV